MYSTVDKISFFSETHVIHRVDKREAKFTDLGGKFKKALCKKHVRPEYWRIDQPYRSLITTQGIGKKHIHKSR